MLITVQKFNFYFSGCTLNGFDDIFLDTKQRIEIRGEKDSILQETTLAEPEY